MKTPASFPLAVTFALLGCATGPALAQSLDNPNRFTAAARVGLNLKAKFTTTTPALPPQTEVGPPTGHGVNRNYDDGYVRVDDSGNAGDLTWNWGYREAAQVPGNDTLLMHSSSAPAASLNSTAKDDPQAGFEFAWLRDLSRSERGALGFKVAFNYTDLDFRSSNPLSAPSQRLTDTYALGGIIPPGDPGQPGWQYAGADDLPGPLIDDAPASRTVDTIPGGATTTGQRSLTGNLFAWKVGPWLEVPFGQRVSLLTGVGIAFGRVNTTLQYQGTTTGAGLGSVTQSYSADDHGWVFGGYIESFLNVQLAPKWNLFAGVEYQPLTKYYQQVGANQASLNPTQGLYLQAGLGFKF